MQALIEKLGKLVKKCDKFIDAQLRRAKDPYPKTVAEVLDDDIKFKPEVIAAVEQFKKLRPWKGNGQEQYNKFQKLNQALSKAYGIEEPILIFSPDRPSCYVPFVHSIYIQKERSKKYSVIVFLHEFGHAIGKNERETCRWSINLFRKCFPKHFDKLEPHGHLLFKKPDDDKK